MIPSIGRIVHYTLSSDDVANICEARSKPNGPRGNTVHQGDIFPALIVRVWGTNEGAAVQLRVMLDGQDDYWATSRSEATYGIAGTWAPAPFVKQS